MKHIIKEMENIYDLLGDIRALYSNGDSHNMCSLARMCQHLLTAVEEETDQYNNYPEIYSLIRTYILKMFKILDGEKNTEVRKVGYDTLSKIYSRSFFL